jgi:hypothetical protein
MRFNSRLDLSSKPTIAFLACTVTVLAVCMFVISLAFAMLTATWNPGFFISGMILLPVASALGVLQYLAAFRSNTTAAIGSTVLLFVGSSMAFLSFAITLGQILIEGSPIPWLPLLFPMCLTGSVIGLAAWMNFRRLRQLKLATPVAQANRRFRFSSQELFVAVTAIACVVALTASIVRLTPPQFAENVSRNEVSFSLPDDARNVSYCQGFRGLIAYEFTVDEQSFIAWVNSHLALRWPEFANDSVDQITVPCEVRRYYSLNSDLEGPHSITVTNGLCFGSPDADGHSYSVFDRTTHRAYYFGKR